MEGQLSTVGVIGAGTMGQGIAQVCAAAGMKVILYDLNDDVLSAAVAKINAQLSGLVSKGKLRQEDADVIGKRINTSTTLEELIAPFIIEAVVEDRSVKQTIYHKLEEVSDSNAIILTNTSSLSVSQLAAKLKHPGRFAGLHFFNPPALMKLVEVVEGSSTTTNTLDRVVSFARLLQKEVVLVKDSPGFIVNRVARLFYAEALKLLEEGVADHETIDDLMRSAGFRMGPFELMDLIGNDVNLAVTQSIYAAFNQEPRFRPSRIQQQKVDSNQLGRKTGKGFYDYAS